jgi:hypothetical protein
MTIVAAVRIGSLPVLFGDFIISSPVGIGVPPMWIPTNPRAGARAVSHSQISGLRKKIELVHAELCLGWSGSALAASAAMRAVAETVANNKPDLDVIRKCLATVDYYKKRELRVELVGWIGPKGKETCFKWSSTKPDKFEFSDNFMIGSGSDLLGEILNSREGVYSEEVVSESDRCILKVLSKLGRFLGGEITLGDSLEKFCGYGLEMIVSGEAGFQYLDEVSFLHIDLMAENADNCRIWFGKVAYKYKSFGSYSVVQVAHMSQTERGYRVDESFITSITPVHGPMPSVDLRTMGQLPYRSNFYCLFFRIRLWNGRMATASVGLPLDESDRSPFRWQNDRVELNRSFVFELIQAILAAAD